jgi:predicted nucleotidyltransferase component of viral defense system
MKTISPALHGAVVEVDQRGLCDLDPSILEKDLLITEVLGLLAGYEWGEVQPVFCGGTSLSKGYGLIQRMSEDIDFKLVLPVGWSKSQTRREMGELRDRLAQRMREADFALADEGITAENENRYFCFALGYTPKFPLVAALRAELRLDFTVHAPLLQPASVQVKPLLAEFVPLGWEETDLQAVAIDETLVEKLVSFLRRTARWSEQKKRDPDDEQLVRHLYDVHQLLAVTAQDPPAKQMQQHLFNRTVAGDRLRFARKDSLFDSNPQRRLEQALEQLQSSAEVEELYERFVDELVWGPAVPFTEARDGFAALASELLQGLDPPP